MGTNSYFQLPPDGSGKRVFTQEHTVGTDVIQAQVMHLGCGHHPEHLQIIDQQGQAYTRYAEGSPTMDAFGNLRASAATILGGYEFTNNSMVDLFTDTTVSGGSILWQKESARTLLSTTSASGSAVTRTTNRYHYYQPGVGTLIIMTLAHGDAGKANNIRRWGYFDENNGLFFELNGTTLNVVLRSNVSGTVVEQRIPQSSWNGDKVDGTGISSMTLNVRRANFYFIDLAWLGVGAVRFGVLAEDGSRWVVHTFKNPNTNIDAYMASGSMPLRFENVNSAATASTSEMKLICSAVYSEAAIHYTYWRYSDIERTSAVTVTNNTPVISLRAKPGTRVGIYPESINLLVYGGAAKISIIDDGVLTGATWSIIGEGIAEGDISATAVTDGSRFKTWYVPAGVTNIDLSTFYETNDEGYCRLADDSDSYIFTIVGTKLDGSTVSVTATINYRELA